MVIIASIVAFTMVIVLFDEIPKIKKETDHTRRDIRKMIAQIQLNLKRFMLDQEYKASYYKNIEQNLEVLEAKIFSFDYNFSKQEIKRSRTRYRQAIKNMSDTLSGCSHEKICQDIAVSTEKFLKHTSQKEGYFSKLLHIRQMLDHVKSLSIQVEEQNIKLNSYIVQATNSKNYYLQKKVESLDDSIAFGKIFVISSMVILFFISLSILFFFIIPFITRRIQKISVQTYDIANGNLDVEIVPHGHDEITKMFEALEYFRKQLIKKKEIEGEREKLVEDLLTSNQELKRFAYICSHDLQEPARMVGLFSQKILEKYDHIMQEDPKLKRYFEFVYDGGVRMQQMIKDILAYSSFSNTIQDVEDVSLNEIIDDQIKIFQTMNPDIIISRDDLPNIKGHRTGFVQIFQNLIGNGLKYQTLGAIAEVKISYIENDKEWIFTVADNGIGIEEKNLKKIFDIFTRLHRRDEYSGTGIGLAICQKVVELYGGKVWVESDYGQGATFFFSIPKG